MPILRFKFLPGLVLAGLLLAAPAFAASYGRSVPKHRTPSQLLVTPPTAEDLFIKVLRSDDLYAYKGRQTTTYWRTGQSVDTLVFHHPPDGRRIYYLNPEVEHGRLLASDGRTEWEYDPRRKDLRQRSLSPGALENDDLLSYTLLRANYLLEVQPKPRSWADRQVYLVTIKRPKGHTLARRFWVDSGSGLILKREIYREDGKLAVTEAFSEITYHPKLLPEIFNLANLAKTAGIHVILTSSPKETPLSLNSLATQLAGKAYAPANLAGYRLVGASTTVVAGRSLLHLRYSDGLNLVSLFEQRRTQAQRPTVVKGMRTTQIGHVPGHISHRASLTTLNWDTATLNVTLMGEMGIQTLRSLALVAVQNK